VVAEEEMRRNAIDREGTDATLAGMQRDLTSQKKALLAENLSLKDMNAALLQELSASESTRRQVEAVVATGPEVVPLLPLAPPPDPQIPLLEGAVGEARNDVVMLQQEMGALTSTLASVAEERDHLQSLLRASTGVIGSPAKGPSLGLTPGPKPSDLVPPQSSPGSKPFTPVKRASRAQPKSGFYERVDRHKGKDTKTRAAKAKDAEEFFQRTPGGKHLQSLQ
jgi:hypothetical protein